MTEHHYLFQQNTGMVEISVHGRNPSNICLLVQDNILLFFSTFKQHFQFLSNKVSCLETWKFVEKMVKKEYVIVTIISIK